MTEIMTSPGVQGYDPRTAAPAGEPVPVTRSEEIEATVGRAAKAPPAWGDWPARRRAEALERIAAAVENAADELVASADLETALGRARLHGEFARTTGQLRLFADVLRDGNYVDAVITTANASLARPDIRRMLRPMGPCVVFSASNFPFAFSVLGGDTASAPRPAARSSSRHTRRTRGHLPGHTASRARRSMTPARPTVSSALSSASRRAAASSPVRPSRRSASPARSTAARYSSTSPRPA